MNLRSKSPFTSNFLLTKNLKIMFFNNLFFDQCKEFFLNKNIKVSTV